MDAEALAGYEMPARTSAFSSKNNQNAMNADTLTGVAKAARASAPISVSMLMIAEAMPAFVPKGPHGLLEASCYYSAANIVAWD